MPYFDYYYSFPFDSDAMELFAGVFGAISSFGSFLGLVCYVLRAMSLYTVARRRELKNPWLAWLPVGFEWLLGSVSDQYQYLVKEKNTSRRKLMVAFSIVTLFSGVVIAVVAVVMTFRLAVSAVMMTESEIARMILAPVMTVMITAMVLSVFSIVLLVLRCVCMYDFYRSCQPDNATLYLVLGIIFGFLEPVFMMIVRRRDEGMPPRRSRIDPQPVYEAQEPWEKTE